MIKNSSIKQWGSEGSVLVFLHYFGGSAQSWSWVAERLMDTFRCIAIDLPGFGGNLALNDPSIQNFAAYVQDQITLSGISHYHLIGHSMGGKIAMQLAANAAEGAVEQLILIAPSPPTTEPLAAAEKEKLLHSPGMREAENLINSITIQSLQEDQMRLAVANQLETDLATRAWWLLTGMEHSILENVQSLNIPVTVIASEDDPAISFKLITEQFMIVFRGAEIIVTKHVGHLIPMEHADWLAGTIRSIVRK